MSNRIITISRQFGSGGRTVGKLVAKELGIPCYDQEILEQLAEKSGFTKEYVKGNSEYSENRGGLFGQAFGGRGFGSTSNQDYLWKIQSQVIREIASKESCVIVGRCADYILRDEDYADCLNVYIHAADEKRADRIVRVYGEREDSPMQRIKDKDKRRAAYYQFYTDMKWGKADNYHICLDAGEIGIEKCAEILKTLY